MSFIRQTAIAGLSSLTENQVGGFASFQQFRKFPIEVPGDVSQGRTAGNKRPIVPVNPVRNTVPGMQFCSDLVLFAVLTGSRNRDGYDVSKPKWLGARHELD